jgi:acyl-CoA reductase-like NAD-dependent aldehyde dehydrogenase
LHDDDQVNSRHFSNGLKKITLELGGNCQYLVFSDADLDKSFDALVQLKWRQAGQACITANRVYKQSSLYVAFETPLVGKTKELNLYHGAAMVTTFGPLTTPAGVDKIEAHVQDALSHDGCLALVCARPVGVAGYSHPPTIVAEAS